MGIHQCIGFQDLGLGFGSRACACWILSLRFSVTCLTEAASRNQTQGSWCISLRTLKGTFRGIACGGGDCDRLKLAPQTYLLLAALQLSIQH